MENRVYDIGPWDTWKVWGGDEYPDFIDKSARWIWSHADGATYTETEYIGVEFPFSTTVTVQNSTNAIMHIIVDNIAKVYVNDSLVGEIGEDFHWAKGGTNYPKIPISLTPGRNVITVRCINTGGPGGLLVSIVGPGNKVLSRTNTSSWIYDEQPTSGGGFPIFGSSEKKTPNIKYQKRPTATTLEKQYYGLSKTTWIWIIIAVLIVIFFSMSSVMVMMMR